MTGTLEKFRLYLVNAEKAAWGRSGFEQQALEAARVEFDRVVGDPIMSEPVLSRFTLVRLELSQEEFKLLTPEVQNFLASRARWVRQTEARGQMPPIGADPLTFEIRADVLRAFEEGR